MITGQSQADPIAIGYRCDERAGMVRTTLTVMIEKIIPVISIRASAAVHMLRLP